MNAEERMTKGQLEEENPIFSEDLSGDSSFPNWKYIRY